MLSDSDPLDENLIRNFYSAMARQAIGPKEEPTIIILLNGHSIRLLPNDFLSYS